MKKILFFANDDMHFYNHLLPIAIGAKNTGHEVTILTNVRQHKDLLEAQGLPVIPLSINRGGMNPLQEMLLLLKVIKIIRQFKPDILHNFTIKPIIYGSIAGFITKTPKIINNFLGMGYMFINNFLPIRILRQFFCLMLRIICEYREVIFIVQNKDDQELLNDFVITSAENIKVQCSVGVPLKDFDFLPEPMGDKIIFALVARMLVDKGVQEFIQAANILQKKNLPAEYWLVGSPDPGNKSSLTEGYLKQAKEVKYLGYQNDVRAIWQQAHVAVLPSYREGLSRTLLEAGAYGRAVITTDADGGRELVQDGVNGLLVPARNAQKLAAAMEKMVLDERLRKELAVALNKDVAEKYASEIIVNNMLQFYN